LPIVPAKLGADSGLVGAATVVFMRQRGRANYAQEAN